MELSFWEQRTWFDTIDYTIVGSGIVGLTCALRLRENYPNAKICIIEKGVLPQGASTKNAGFACFGSISEILDDLQSHTEAEVVALIQKRIDGLNALRKLLGDKAIDYQEYGGYELFAKSDHTLYQECIEKIPEINRLLFSLFDDTIYETVANTFGFQDIAPQLILNKKEGQIDTGKMMKALLSKAYASNIQIINNCQVTKYDDDGHQVVISTDHFTFSTKKLLIATNGFAQKLDISSVNPARAQVLITDPIPNLRLKGTFHIEQGYYYFRNIDSRILLGGGRNLDFKAEETTQLGQTEMVQNKLERLLREVILPDKQVKIAHRWSGIMGVGLQKKPIIKDISQNVSCGVRLGGMGIAIGSTVGRELADLIVKKG